MRTPPLSGECKATKRVCSAACKSDSECTTRFGAGHICKGGDLKANECGSGVCLHGFSCTEPDDPACKP